MADTEFADNGAEMQGHRSIVIPDGLHPDTAKLVCDFAEAVAAKLRQSEVKYGYLDAWKLDHWRDGCAAELLRHVHKGDPRDVAAYCAFAWFHGWSVAPAPQGSADALIEAMISDAAAAADEIERLRFQYEHLDGLFRKLVEAAGEAGHVNGEGSDFAYLLMSLRMGPPDRYRTALGRVAGMEQPPGGLSQMVGMMKQIAQNALEARDD